MTLIDLAINDFENYLVLFTKRYNEALRRLLGAEGGTLEDEHLFATSVVTSLALSFIASDYELDDNFDLELETSELEIVKSLLVQRTDAFDHDLLDEDLISQVFGESTTEWDEFKYNSGVALVVLGGVLEIDSGESDLNDMTVMTLNFISRIVVVNGVTSGELHDFGALVGLFLASRRFLDGLGDQLESEVEKISSLNEFREVLNSMLPSDFLDVAKDSNVDSLESIFGEVDQVTQNLWDLFHESLINDLDDEDLLNRTVVDNAILGSSFESETENLTKFQHSTLEEAKSLIGEINSSDGKNGLANPSLLELLSQLENLVGLSQVKAEVKRIASRVEIDKKRVDAGLSVTTSARHLVFVGNPGTGKTSVARILAGIFRECGLLRNGHLLEVGRSDLVAGYLGQTATKVTSVVEKALGGVLFIDEAYALKTKEDDFFGQEAIDTLVSLMENHRDDLVVIIAGYPDEMDEFMLTNPGLKSRFPKTITFHDYSPEELLSIFLSMLRASDYIAEKDAKLAATEYLVNKSRVTGFGNARGVRNMFEATIDSQALRVSEIEQPTRDELSQILRADIPLR